MLHMVMTCVRHLPLIFMETSAIIYNREVTKVNVCLVCLFYFNFNTYDEFEI